jgi:Acetyl-coenzyme A synthetase N-terminus
VLGTSRILSISLGELNRRRSRILRVLNLVFLATAITRYLPKPSAYLAMLDDPDLLFSPKLPRHSHAFRFLDQINETHSLHLSDYHDLYNWSTSHIDAFWSTIWDYSNIIGHKGGHIVDTTALPSDNPQWFSDATLNWAENMLSCRSPHKIALIQTCGYIHGPDSLPVLIALSSS